MVIGGTKVLLVGRSPHVCAELRLRIENRRSLVVVGEARNYASGLSIAAVETPDFIVVDLASDDEGAVQHISDLVHATRHLLVVSDTCQGTMLESVKRMGCDLVPREQIVAAILKRLDPNIYRTVELTEQETIVLDLVRRGLSNRRIAEHLEISEATVSEVIEVISKRLGAEDRFELIINGLREGLISLNS